MIIYGYVQGSFNGDIGPYNELWGRQRGRCDLGLPIQGLLFRLFRGGFKVSFGTV